MCKFHQDVAFAVAKNPITGEQNMIQYALVINALAKFWINKYMPDMSHLDGISNYEMATQAAQASFRRSDIQSNSTITQSQRDLYLHQIRVAVDEVIGLQSLSLAKLNLPQNPLRNAYAINQMMVDVYEGDPEVELSIRDEIKNKKFIPMADALRQLFLQPEFAEKLEALLKNNISTLMVPAPQIINQNILAVYESLPRNLRMAFSSCSLHGGGGALAHIIVCGGLNVTIGGFSGAFMNAAMYAIAPTVAVTTTYAVEKYRANGFNPYKYILPIAISLSAAFGVSKILPHEHSADPRMGWFYSLDTSGRHNQLQKDYQRYLELPSDLRKEVDREASNLKMTVSMFMTSLDVCGGDLVPKIRDFEANKQPKLREVELNLQ